MVGIICPPPVGIGLTDLPNIGGASGPPGPPSSGTTAISIIGCQKFNVSLNPLYIAVVPELGGAGGATGPPQYLADQLTLFKPGVGRLCPPLPLAPLKFFTFRHH